MKRFLLRSVALFLCAVCFIFLLPSCAKQEKALVGRWETQIEDEEIGKLSMVYHFTEEGEIFLEQKKGAKIPFSIPFGTYRIDGDRVTVQSDGEETSFTFSVSDRTLTLIDSDQNEVVFQRIEVEEQ